MNGLAFLALVLSVLLSCVAAWIIAFRYRRRLQQLMRAPHARDAVAPSIDMGPAPRPAYTTVSLADNRAAGMRLSVVLITVSCLIAMSSAGIWWTLTFPQAPLAPRRVAVIALLHLWPVIPALALVWRWSLTRMFTTFLLWCGISFIVMLWRQIEFDPLQVLTGMASEIGLALFLVSLVFLGNATRAVAPWILMPAALLMYSSLSVFYLMVQLLERGWTPLVSLFGWLERYLGLGPTIYAFPLLFIFATCVVAWWPARRLGSALARAYSRKWLSDLLVVFVGVWAFALTDRALTINQAAAVTMYLPLLFIPGAMWLARRLWPRRTRPPTLLVLRVFQQDARARSLFDHVVERWRLSGNTVMIAGTDLADRMLDAHDIFQFLDGQLARRFVSSLADVARCIAAFDMEADIDGRHRVNECYCHDTTWQDVLQTLVRRSDIVLMDLAGFTAHNTGCRYELATLAAAPGELRVVVLTDSRTDRAAAQAEISFAPQHRFSWVDVSQFNASKRREVLARLCASDTARAGQSV